LVDFFRELDLIGIVIFVGLLLTVLVPLLRGTSRLVVEYVIPWVEDSVIPWFKNDVIPWLKRKMHRLPGTNRLRQWMISIGKRYSRLVPESPKPTGKKIERQLVETDSVLPLFWLKSLHGKPNIDKLEPVLKEFSTQTIRTLMNSENDKINLFNKLIEHAESIKATDD